MVMKLAVTKLNISANIRLPVKLTCNLLALSSDSIDQNYHYIHSYVESSIYYILRTRLL